MFLWVLWIILIGKRWFLFCFWWVFFFYQLYYQSVYAWQFIRQKKGEISSLAFWGTGSYQFIIFAQGTLSCTDFNLSGGVGVLSLFFAKLDITIPIILILFFILSYLFIYLGHPPPPFNWLSTPMKISVMYKKSFTHKHCHKFQRFDWTKINLKISYAIFNLLNHKKEVGVYRFLKLAPCFFNR